MLPHTPSGHLLESFSDHSKAQLLPPLPFPHVPNNHDQQVFRCYPVKIRIQATYVFFVPFFHLTLHGTKHYTLFVECSACDSRTMN